MKAALTEGPQGVPSENKDRPPATQGRLVDTLMPLDAPLNNLLGGEDITSWGTQDRVEVRDLTTGSHALSPPRKPIELLLDLGHIEPCGLLGPAQEPPRLPHEPCPELSLLGPASFPIHHKLGPRGELVGGDEIDPAMAGQ